MNVTQIIARARRIAKYTTSNLDDSGALDLLNVIKDEFWSEIVSKTNEDYNWDEWKTDTNTNIQGEYSLPPLTSGSDGTKALNTIAICYDGDVYADGGLVYVKATPCSPSALSNDWEYYKRNQSKTAPIFFIAENSIFIAPVPTVAVPNGLKMTGIKKIADYSLTTVEADIGLPVDFHRVLVFGLAYEMALDKGIPEGEIQSYLNNYEFTKSKAIKALSSRREWSTYLEYPDALEVNTLFYP